MACAHSSDLAQDYVELRTRSAFSFLEGCSDPEDPRRSCCGAGARRSSPSRTGTGSLERLDFTRRRDWPVSARWSGARSPSARDAPLRPPGRRTGRPGSPCSANRQRAGEALPDPHEEARATEQGARSPGPRARNLIRVGWDELEAEAGHWSVLLRGDERLTPTLLDRANRAFGERLAVDVSHSLDRRTERLGRYAADLAEARRVRVVASGDVRCAWPRDRRLLDALICLRERRTLDTAGRHLLPTARATSIPAKRSPAASAIIRPGSSEPARSRSAASSPSRTSTTIPRLPPRPGETQMSRLRELTRIGARNRYGARPDSRVAPSSPTSSKSSRSSISPAIS